MLIMHINLKGQYSSFMVITTQVISVCKRLIKNWHPVIQTVAVNSARFGRLPGKKVLMIDAHHRQIYESVGQSLSSSVIVRET